ncbi:hypothetical protein Bhyg_06210, partial [Pseudolycoriella hygida]
MSKVIQLYIFTTYNNTEEETKYSFGKVDERVVGEIDRVASSLNINDDKQNKKKKIVECVVVVDNIRTENIRTRQDANACISLQVDK